jgi:hypothetical protein
MGLRVPIPIAVVLVAACGLGIAAVYQPWASVNLLGAVISAPGSNGWAGQVTAVAFGILAAACLGQVLWPRLPRTVPLALAVLVGLGVVGTALVPSLLYPYAEVSVGDGDPPARIPVAMGIGKYLAVGAGLVTAVVAGWQLWRNHGLTRAGATSADPGAGRGAADINGD